MPCCHPFKAFRTGLKTENGKDDFILCSFACPDRISLSRIKKPVALDNAPHLIEDGEIWLTDPLSVPCGSCVGCRMEKAREWKIRNCLELQYSKEAHFLTLTYDDEHLPIDENGQPYLEYRDVQLFLKRLRKRGLKFRYFGCGEHGDKKSRPHWHMIYYGHLEGFRMVGINRFECDLVSHCWQNGRHIIERVEPGSIAYVCGYVEKKQLDPDFYSYPVKPFNFMSRRPGIGMQYFADHKDDFEHTKKVYGHFGSGLMDTSAKLPKAFKKKLDGVPWFEEWKEIAKLAGESIDETQRVIYGLSSMFAIGDAQEQGSYIKLNRKKRGTL